MLCGMEFFRVFVLAIRHEGSGTVSLNRLLQGCPSANETPLGNSYSSELRGMIDLEKR
jgi:hypothetical protein